MQARKALCVRRLSRPTCFVCFVAAITAGQPNSWLQAPAGGAPQPGQRMKKACVPKAAGAIASRLCCQQQLSGWLNAVLLVCFSAMSVVVLAVGFASTSGWLALLTEQACWESHVSPKANMAADMASAAPLFSCLGSSEQAVSSEADRALSAPSGMAGPKWKGTSMLRAREPVQSCCIQLGHVVVQHAANGLAGFCAAAGVGNGHRRVREAHLEPCL